MSTDYDITIKQGSTFALTLKYGQPQFTVKAITGITKSGQAVVTATGHGLTIDWPVWVVGVAGMDQLNHTADELRQACAAYYGYYVDANSLRLDVDTTRFGTYTSGGEVLYHPPVNLTGYTARMQIRETVESTATLHSMTTEDGGITLGGAAGTITLLISATDTAAFTFESGVYDLELVAGDGTVTTVIEGNVCLVSETTR
jgi:hypothetical protein